MARDDATNPRGSDLCNLTAQSTPATALEKLQNMQALLEEQSGQMSPEVLANLMQSVQDITAQVKLEQSEMIPIADALCPLDGRYSNIAKILAPYFSEYALVKYRVKVECLWLWYLITLNCSDILKSVRKKEKRLKPRIMSIYEEFDHVDFRRVKEIERKKNHDVKAVEYFVRECLESMGLEKLDSFVHIGCTSEDITNLSYAQMIRDFLMEVYYPKIEDLIQVLDDMSEENKDRAMLAHTHGQPATPTTFGKEMLVYSHRLREALKYLKAIKILGKFNGATGNYAAIDAGFRDICWPDKAEEFVEKYIKVSFNPVTTQIEPHDFVARIMDAVRHINNIVIDLDSDMWLYVSMFYCKLKVVNGEVGSSTMPHKVNPIQFENSRGNGEISNVLAYGISDTLPKSRLQRDLSDSAIQRNIGMAFGYSMQLLISVLKGLGRISPNAENMSEDLDNNWEVLGEAIQTVLRKNGFPNAYETLKDLTRGRKVDKRTLRDFIMGLEIPDDDKVFLMQYTPDMYTGYASMLCDTVLSRED